MDQTAPATVLSKLLGRTITYRELTFEQNKDAMIRAGVPEQIAEMNAQAFSLTAGGDAEWVTQDVRSPHSPSEGTGHHGPGVGRRGARDRANPGSASLRIISEMSGNFQ